jgi:hypothetical protein
MTGAPAMSTPSPGRPRRNRKMPRMGAANVAMKAAHQTMAAPASPCMPSGPLPKMKTGKCHQECRERQISNHRDGAKNLHETPFARIYRPALAWAGHTFGAHGQAALVRALLTVTR